MSCCAAGTGATHGTEGGTPDDLGGGTDWCLAYRAPRSHNHKHRPARQMSAAPLAVPPVTG